MSSVSGIETKPEITVRKYLFRRGIRYRKNDKRYPGKPDIVIPKYKTNIFVHGCFWHGHRGCKRSSLPKTNTSFWADKIHKNQLRDDRNKKELEEMGWSVVTIWECKIKREKCKIEYLYEIYKK